MVNRRDFLIGIGGGGLLLGSVPLARAVANTRDEEGRLPALVREEDLNSSLCQLCPSACSLKVRMVNGWPVSIKGNTLSPINRGGLCARGAAGLQLYYDPDRLSGPFERSGGARAEITWEKGIESLAAKLKAAAAAGDGRIGVIRGGADNLTGQLLGRLARSAGSDWVVDAKTPGSSSAAHVVREMHGAEGALVPDLAGADFVFSFESDLLEEPSRMMTLHRGFADLRSGGGRFVHAGPRMGVTGAKADEWLPIRPSTGGVLALGVAHMIIKEGFVDRQFVARRVAGYEDGTDENGKAVPGLRNWILRNFSPQTVADITGVGWDRIIRTARQFGEADRALALPPLWGSTQDTTFDWFAVHLLNALKGSVDAPGGVLLARRAPFARMDAGGSGATRSLEDLVEEIHKTGKSPIDVCIVHEADPAFDAPNPTRVVEALKKIPTLVTTSPVLNDTVALAHLGLPDALWLERAADAFTWDGGGRPVVAVTRAAAKPLANSKATADVVLAAAAAAGGKLAAAFTWKSYAEVRASLDKALMDSGVGDVFTDVHSSTWSQLMERSGWRSADYANATALGKLMDESGGWWDPVYHHGEWRRVLPNEGHRLALAPVRARAREDIRKPPEDAPKDQAALYLYPEPALAVSPGANLPYLQDLASPLVQRGWRTTAEVNPVTAEQLGFANGDEVTLKNDTGEMRVALNLTHMIRPGVLAVHTGGGRHEESGRFASAMGSNPWAMVATRYDEADHEYHQEPTFVRIERAGRQAR